MGNPNAGLNGVETQFKTDRDEPLIKQLQIRVPESLNNDLREIPNWQDFVRKVLRKAIAERHRRSALAKSAKKS
jgi:hypothetical protein